MRVKQFDQLGEIGERACEAVDLVDGDDIDVAGPDLGEKLLEGRPVQGGTGKGAIIIALADQPPSFLCLAL